MKNPRDCNSLYPYRGNHYTLSQITQHPDNIHKLTSDEIYHRLVYLKWCVKFTLKIPRATPVNWKDKLYRRKAIDGFDYITAILVLLTIVYW